MPERQKRTKVSMPNLDMTKPIPVKQINADADTQDCFTFLWKPDHPMCAICSENVICGIQYSARQSKKVKEIEVSKGGYLDSNLFDCIEPADLLEWCRIKERTTQQLIDKVAKFSQCADEDTVVDYCISFITSTKGVKVKGGIIIVT